MAHQYYMLMEKTVYRKDDAIAIKSAIRHFGDRINNDLLAMKAARKRFARIVTLDDHDAIDVLTKTIATLSHIKELNESFLEDLQTVAPNIEKQGT